MWYHSWGQVTWFDRINEYCVERDLAIEHYIISSGNFEFIKGSEIVPHFEKVFASKFMFDEND